MRLLYLTLGPILVLASSGLLPKPENASPQGWFCLVTIVSLSIWVGGIMWYFEQGHQCWPLVRKVLCALFALFVFGSFFV